MRIAFVIFVSLLFSATSAQSQPEQPGSPAPAQPTSPPPTQISPAPPQQQPPAPPPQVQAQPGARSEAAVPPPAQGRWIHTDEHGSIWIPKPSKQSTANGSVPVPKTPEQPTGNGQWVYTAQYGWLWMPYAIQYVHEPSVDRTYPQAFVYYPTHGWTWVVAPWVWGWGVVPFYGSQGPWHFAWYRGPTFVHPGWGGGGYRGASISPRSGI